MQPNCHTKSADLERKKEKERGMEGGRENGRSRPSFICIILMQACKYMFAKQCILCPSGYKFKMASAMTELVKTKQTDTIEHQQRLNGNSSKTQ